MRLKTIEIKGFKSFGDRVVIHFDKGTTSIVGPNGSGKSNVVDALRWVLGEQKTRMLRSEKMENIIFNGTRTRKPANLAEVALTFENTKNILPVEYATVTITRKLYRSGDSEYYLNGTQCRLKDITDLFMDTGVGPDSYSIIELKMVEELLNERNDTVKLLMEEAAGITKYKLRKRQTMSRLEETEADLNRVNDLLLEIEKSMKQLEAQARRVDRFNRLKEKYRATGIRVGILSLASYRENMQRLSQKESLMKDDKVELHAKASALEADLEKLKLKSVDKEKSLSDAQKGLNEKLIAITKLENENNSNEEKLRYIDEKRNEINAQIEKDREVETDLNNAIEELNSDKMAEQARHDLAIARLNELKEEADTCKQAYDTVLGEANELSGKLNQVRQQLNEFETMRAVNETKTAALTDEISRLSRQADTSEENLRDASGALERLQPEMQDREAGVQALQQKLQLLGDRIRTERQLGQELNTRLADTSRKADASANEYELTRNMIEQMEGYPESIRYLRKQSGRYESLPLLSDLIRCEDRYRTAIENFLEPVLNHFVVETRREAWEAMQLLREQGKGRASFFVLDALPAAPAPQYEDLDGCVGALDIAEFKTRYTGLFSELLGHVYITGKEHLDEVDIPESGRFILLSENGHYLKQRYVLSGGSAVKSAQRTGKLRNLEHLEKQMADYRAGIASLQEEIAGNSQLQTELETEKEGLDRELNERTAELQRTASAVTAAETNKSHLDQSLSSLRQNMDQLREQVSLLEKGVDVEKFNQEQIDSLRRELETLTAANDTAQAERTRKQDELNEKSSALNAQQIEVLQLQNKIQNIIRDTGYKSAQIRDIEQSREAGMKETTDLDDRAGETKALRDSTAEKLQSMIQDKLASEKALNHQEDEYYQLKGNIDREEKNISELRQKREQTDVILREIHDELGELKIRINSANERLRIEFSVSPEEIERHAADSPASGEGGSEESTSDSTGDGEAESLDTLRESAEKLRLKIEQFGAINPMALESFNEVKARHEFITKEKADLVEASESLMQTISEIEQTAREKFLEAFEQVRMHFIRVFRSLFSEEDDCNLVLTNPENPLESDIHILAKPKGKRPISIHQLSGGEKSLTATALLFGIYLLKPSPFCVLDEVDAPLDDANIEKFNRIIRKFSEQSQFIVITHNKRTMAATDIMYGITMAEMGVTQVVPVDLQEFEAV